MRFDLRSFLASLRAQCPNGLDHRVKLPCTHPGCRAGKMMLGASFRDGSGKIVPLLVHVDGMDNPVCYMCYRSFYGGHVEDYASFLVREHGVDRYLIAEFEAPPEVPFIARPAAPAPRPAAPAPRGPSSRPLPPRRSSGQAEFAGGQSRPEAPAHRWDRRPEAPRWTPPAHRRVAESKPTLGDLGGLADFKAEFKTAEDRAAAEAKRQAAADQKWLDDVCARGTYRVVGERFESDSAVLVLDKKPVLFPGGITGVIVGEGVSFVGVDDAPAAAPMSREDRRALTKAGWRRSIAATKIGNGKPVVVVTCDADGTVDHELQTEVETVYFQSPETPAWKKQYVSTEPAGTVDNASVGPRRIGFDGFSDILIAALDATVYQEDEIKLLDLIKRIGLVRLGKLWDTALDMSAALDELDPSRVAHYRLWEEIRARRASAPAEEPAAEVVSPVAAPSVA